MNLSFNDVLLLISLILPLLVPFGLHVGAVLASRLPANVRSELLDVARTVVVSVEQSSVNQNSAQKKQAAMTALRILANMVPALKRIPDSALSTAIEFAVSVMNGVTGQTAAQPVSNASESPQVPVGVPTAPVATAQPAL